MSAEQDLFWRESRRQKLLAHAKAGLSKAEACDLEGCNPSIVQTEVVVKHKAKFRDDKTRKQPVGFDNKKVQQVARALAVELAPLVEQHHRIELAAMTGLTPTDQAAAMANSPPWHNWTLGQMARLAAAKGITIEELLNRVTKRIGVKVGFD